MSLRSPALLMLVCAAALGTAQSEHLVTSYGLVIETPEMKSVQVRKDVTFDKARSLSTHLYTPEKHGKGEKLPVVVFINGVGDSPQGKVKDWGQYTSWPRYLAANGYASMCHDSRGGPASVEDLKSLLGYLRSNAAELGIDEKRIGIWACSANVQAAVPFLMESAEPGVSCGVLYYGIGRSQTLRMDLPVLLVRAGKDNPQLNAGIDNILRQAMTQRAPWTVLNVPTGHHAFDTLDDTEESRDAIRQTLAFFDLHLKPNVGESAPKSEARDALAFWFGQEWDKAAVAYKAYSKKHPQDATSKMRWGMGLVRTGKGEQGVAILEELLSANGSLEVHNELASAYNLLRRPTDALKVLDAALAKYPDVANLHASRGNTLAGLGRHEEGEKSFLKAVEILPNHWLFLSQLGSTQIALKKYDAAIENLTKSIGFAPQATSFYNLACAYALAGKKDQAFEALNNAIERGFANRELLSSDADIASLREDPRFGDVLKKLGS